MTESHHEVVLPKMEVAPPLMGSFAPTSLKRSIRGSSMWRTAAGRAYDDAFKRHTPGLRAYLAVRLRSHAKGRDAFEQLRDAVEGEIGTSLFAQPGPKALLYHWARHIANAELEGRQPTCGIEQAPWDSAPLGSPRGYGDFLDRVRGSVSEPELETLELAIAHGLNERELAFVLEEPRGDVQQRMKATLAWLEVQVGTERLARGRKLTDLVSDALRVLPPPAGDLAETDGPPPPLAKGTVISERFTVESCLGGGAFGYVYRARDVRVPTHVVALKLLHRPAKTDTAREGAMAEVARITSAFHPSLVQLKEHGWYSGRLWFVMPWYAGDTLEDRAADAPLTAAEAAHVLLPIARAVAALHAAGIRHQDVKPENILLAKLTTHGEVLPVLLDLGVAAHSEDLSVAGTPMYFAPEMATRVTETTATVPIDEKADVFALGLTFLHAIIPPPKDEPDFDVFMLARSSGVTVPRDRRLRRASEPLGRWLALDPKERPTAAELATELEALSQGQKAKRRERTRAWVILAALALGGVVALGVQRVTGANNRVLPGSQYIESARVHGLRERVRVAEERAAGLEAMTLGEAASSLSELAPALKDASTSSTPDPDPVCEENESVLASNPDRQPACVDL